MPLTQRVTFKTTLKEKNLFRVPKLIRWQFKLDPSEILKVTVSIVGSVGVRESFFAKMYKDGRVHVPQVPLALLKHYEPNIENSALEVTLEPA